MDLTQVDDLKLLQEIIAGNELALTELFNRYCTFLKKEAFYRLRDRQLAEEAVNDIFVSLWKRRRKVQIDVSLKQYLFHAIRKHCAYVERGLKMYKQAINYKEDIDIDKAHGFDPTTLDEKELRYKLYRALVRISSASNRKAFVLFFVYRVPQKQIALAMNISLDAVKKKISRTAQQVRRYLMGDE